MAKDTLSWSIDERARLGEPTLASIGAFIDRVARDLDPATRYVRELRVALEAAVSVEDYLARLEARERVSEFQRDGRRVSEGERGRSWLDSEIWSQMDVYERTLANLLTGETRMLWAGDAAADFERLGELLARFSEPVSILCVPCATGKEAFSLAIAGLAVGLQLHVLGVDRQPAFIERAATGVLVPHPRDWDWARAGEFLERDVEGRTRVVPRVLERCEFRPGDVLTGSLPPGPFQLVSCRNLLGYFRGEQLLLALRNLKSRVAAPGVLWVDPFVSSSFELRRAREWLEQAGFRRCFADAGFYEA